MRSFTELGIQLSLVDFKMNSFYISPQSTDFLLLSQQVSHQECLQISTHSRMPGTGGALKKHYPWPGCKPGSLWKGGRGQGSAYLASGPATGFAGSETVVSSSAAAASGAYIPDSYQAFWWKLKLETDLFKLQHWKQLSKPSRGISRSSFFFFPMCINNAEGTQASKSQVMN